MAKAKRVERTKTKIVLILNEDEANVIASVLGSVPWFRQTPEARDVITDVHTALDNEGADDGAHLIVLGA